MVLNMGILDGHLTKVGLFAREILDAVIATRTIEDISHSGLGIMRYQYNILARYIHHRISARGPVLHGWIPHIRLTVQKLLSLKGQGSSVSREELEWEACASKAAVEGAHAILFMRTDERPISKVENDTEEDCLALAAWIGDFDLVKSLHKGTNLETFFGTPSWAAARRGHVEIVRYCLEHRAELTPTDGLMTSIGAAASMGHEKVVQLYLDLPEFNVEGRPDVISAVHRAAKENQVTTYKMLLAHAKRVDTHYNYVKALDHSFVYACKRGALDTAKLALEYGANIEQTDAGPRNCLQNAAISGNVELVKMLLEGGASVFPAEEINYR
jgi:hypothetical protein